MKRGGRYEEIQSRGYETSLEEVKFTHANGDLGTVLDT